MLTGVTDIHIEMEDGDDAVLVGEDERLAVKERALVAAHLQLARGHEVEELADRAVRLAREVEEVAVLADAGVGLA